MPQQKIALPLNFSHDFLPERSLLARLIAFAGNGGSGDKLEIGKATGIPTGESSGKVEPIIYYALGMGLISVVKEDRRWTLELTHLGRIVKLEDPYLSEPVTLWLIHLMLCRRSGLTDPPTGLADAWFALFAEGPVRLGSSFELNAYRNYLIERHGKKGYLKGLAGLVIRSYFEPTCMGSINTLSNEVAAEGAVYARCSAPSETSHFPAYSACFCIVWDELFAGHDQIALDEYFEATRLLSVLGWDGAKAKLWFDWMADQGLLQLDRQTGNTLALRLQDTTTVINGIYDELV